MSKAYELLGTIVLIEETQSFASGFTKRAFVVDDGDEKYPQQIKFEAVKDGCTRLDSYNPGDGIKVHFNLRGNEHNGKYYTNVQAWKMEPAPELSQGARSTEYGKKEEPRRSDKQNGAPPPSSVPADEYQEDDDIPF